MNYLIKPIELCSRSYAKSFSKAQFHISTNQAIDLRLAWKICGLKPNANDKWGFTWKNLRTCSSLEEEKVLKQFFAINICINYITINFSFLLINKLEFIWVIFIFCLCPWLFKSYFVFECLLRPWVHSGAQISLPVPGTVPILLISQDPTPVPETVSSCPREVVGFFLHLSWLIPASAYPHSHRDSWYPGLGLPHLPHHVPCPALAALTTLAPRPGNHQLSQHHDNIYS